LQHEIQPCRTRPSPLVFRKSRQSLGRKVLPHLHADLDLPNLPGNRAGLREDDGRFRLDHLFPDVLGMVYNYPNLHWTFDATLVGTGVQHTPVMMYILTHAYFMTYHTTAMVVLRRLRTSRLGQSSAWVFPIAIFAAAYFWAWMETFAMANPALAEVFYYKDLNRMLSIGSITYSCFFITSFPIFHWLDEKLNDTWGLFRTTAAALSASMLTFFLLDLWTKYIGPL
jgi:cycloeucalenol cycloisomerase